MLARFVRKDSSGENCSRITLQMTQVVVRVVHSHLSKCLRAPKKLDTREDIQLEVRERDKE